MNTTTIAAAQKKNPRPQSWDTAAASSKKFKSLDVVPLGAALHGTGVAVGKTRTVSEESYDGNGFNQPESQAYQESELLQPRSDDLEDKDADKALLDAAGDGPVAAEPNGGFEDGADYVPFPSFDDEDDSGYASGMISDKSPPPTAPPLCQEQRDLCDTIISGANVFYTGSAGCGKSTALKAFVARLRDMGNDVQIVCPTGISALNVGGLTIWSYMGWHPGSMKLTLEELAHNARWKTNVAKRLCKTDVLVIDEVSMFENHLLERIDICLRSARSDEYRVGEPALSQISREAFGGLQVVITGDFYQLPPVGPFEHCLYCGHLLSSTEGNPPYFHCDDKQHGPFAKIDKWAFASKAWKRCNFRNVELKQIHRQQDRSFIELLEKMKTGQLTETDRDLLLKPKGDMKNATKLYPRIYQVDQVNDRAFAKLKDPTYSFNCVDDFYWNKEEKVLAKHFVRNASDGSLKHLDDEGHQFKRYFHMRVGMLVILRVNINVEIGLVNGAQGVIVGFQTHDPTKMSEQIGEHAKTKQQQIETFIGRADAKMWPLVEFHGKGQPFKRLIKPHCFIQELGNIKPHSWISRTQIPLTAAWALSIHKSQGMSLKQVEVDLKKCFEKGQPYVAMSRAESLDGLKVHSLGNIDLEPDPEVVAFYRDIVWE